MWDLGDRSDLGRAGIGFLDMMYSLQHHNNTIEKKEIIFQTSVFSDAEASTDAEASSAATAKHV